MTNDPFLRPGPAGRSLEQASPYPPPPTNPQEEPSAGAVREYDPRWPTQFATERALLRELLQPWLTTDIEHVGSTAVPGLPAKPCIDMLAGVADLEQARAAGEVLRHHGYHYRVHRPEAHLFEKPGVGDWRRHTHHLHLTEPGSDLWRERLAFRDALREDAALVVEYNDWKIQHLLDEAEGPYAASKRPLVLRVLAARDIALKPDEQRLVAPIDGGGVE